MTNFVLLDRAHVAPALVRVLAVATLCLSMSAAAQEVWIGRPTIGDHLRHQLGQAIQHQQNAVRAKKEFTADIASARKAFFATAAKPETRAAVEKRFAELLLGKDYIYLAGILTTGTGKASHKQAWALQMITGGELDGGIAPPARPAFDAWVNAVRTSLGARSPDEVLFLLDREQLVAALNANVDRYEAYKVLRDQFEIDSFNNRRALGQSAAPVMAAVEAATLPNGDRKLHSKKVVLFGLGRLTDTSTLKDDQRRRQFSEFLAAAKAAGPQQVIECAYGPMTAHADGATWTLVYQTYRFWYRTVPKGLEEVVSWKRGTFPPGGGYDLSYLSWPMALDECGETRNRIDELTKQHLQARRAAPPSQASAMGVRDLRNPAPSSDATADAQQTRPAGAAPEQQARRPPDPRQCAALAAQLERERAQAQAAPPQYAARFQARLQSREDAYARVCSG